MSSARNFGRVRSAAQHLSGGLRIACGVLRPKPLVAVVGASVISFAGCFSISDGIPPPLDAFCYPTGLVVSPGRTALYVTNSDFELQYSGGTVQALDLEALRRKSLALRAGLNEAVYGDDPSGMPPADPQSTSATCQRYGLTANDNTVLYPGPCSYVDAAPFIKKSVVIGAFATAATMALRPDPCINGRGARLFVAVRGDPSVTYFDVSDDRELSCSSGLPKACLPCADQIGCFDCGDETNDGRCDKTHIVGKDPAQSQRELTLPVDPYGMDVDERGEAIVVAHQTNQTASLVVNRWGTPAGNACVADVPALEYYSASLSPGPTGVSSLPVPLLIAEKKIPYTPGFVVTYRASPEFTLLRYEDDSGSGVPRPFLTRSLSAGVATAASAVDSRGVAIDATERQACEQACGTMDREICLRGCAENHPLGVYMANRAPAALVIGRIETKFTEGPGLNGGVEVTGAYEVPSFHDSVPLAFGTSHIELGTVVNANGGFSRRIFAVAFDSRFVFSYDIDARRVDAIIRTGRGPHAITFDSGYECGVDVAEKDCTPDKKIHPYATMYISHFTDSYVGVVDLDMRNRATFGSIYMTLGKPVPPKGSQ